MTDEVTSNFEAATYTSADHGEDCWCWDCAEEPECLQIEAPADGEGDIVDTYEDDGWLQWTLLEERDTWTPEAPEAQVRTHGSSAIFW
jgi:hypothetical protein